MQRGDWRRLFEYFKTKDDETSRTIAVIMAGYEPQHVWRFLDFVAGLQPQMRLLHSGSLVACCYIIGRMGQTNVKKSLTYLSTFLKEEPLVRDSVSAALSNLWVLNPRKTSVILYDSWISANDQNDSLAEIAVGSSAYLARNDPNKVRSFLQSVSRLENRKIADLARSLLNRYLTDLAKQKRAHSKPKMKVKKMKGLRMAHNKRKKKHKKE